MSIELIHHYVTKLRAAKGTNNKKAILTEAFGITEEFERFLQYVYNPQLSYYQSELNLGAYAKMMVRGRSEVLDGVYSVLYQMNSKALLGKVGAAALAKAAHELDDQGKELINIILQHDLKAGVGTKTINNAYGSDLIEILPYQRYENMTIDLLKGMDFKKGVYSQLKSDGMFCNGFLTSVAGGYPTFKMRSRSGSYLDCLQVTQLGVDISHTAVENNITGNHVLHGELLVWDVQLGGVLPREVSNGILNSVIQTGAPLEDRYNLIYRLWDMITEEEWKAKKSEREYQDRLREVINLTSLFESTSEHSIEVTESRVVHSFEEAVTHFKEKLDEKEEGTLIKPFDMPWGDATTKDGVKMKLEMECELVVVGYNDGDKNGKHSATFGSLQCESADGKLATGVSGMSDALRAEIAANLEAFKGSIVTVRSNGVQDNSTESVLSLFLSRLIEIRKDKSEANTLEEIYNIQASVIDDIQRKLLAS